MKRIILYSIFIFATLQASSQSCKELMDLVKSKGSGSTMPCYNSDALSSVSFYDIEIENRTMYFAIVCFKRKGSYNCTEYIYQVASDTKMKFTMSFNQSAGEAFWKYIEPYGDNLNCGPQL